MKRHVVFIMLGALLGAAGGSLYWSNIGCASGGCTITAHPLNSTFYGALLGGLLASTAHGFVNKKTPNEQRP